ncbi:thermonuclease family protein [Salinisphaera orenii]|uniref:thermonuclease family protein n=1 Tax=Salinisphaera orenii TaxID=856731 RepID=UPI00296FF718
MLPSGFLLVACLFCAAVAVTASAQSFRGEPRIVDGDTIEIGGQDFRFHGIDAPESGQRCLRPDGRLWPCGKRATEALADRIGDRSVRCEQTDKDHYGRIVAVCYADNIDLNAWLVRQGWALAYREYSTDYVDEERAAKRRELGVWRGDFVTPADWRDGERLEGSRPAPSGSAKTGQSGPDRDCGSFDSWDAAQAFFEQSQPGDPHQLDGNGDGVACESLR